MSHIDPDTEADVRNQLASDYDTPKTNEVMIKDSLVIIIQLIGMNFNWTEDL